MRLYGYIQFVKYQGGRVIMALRKYIKHGPWKKPSVNGYPLFPREYFVILKNKGLVYMPSYSIDDEWEDDEVLAWAEALHEEEEIEEQEK